MGIAATLRAAAVVACACAALAPLLVARDVPLVDLPAHLAVVDVWNRYHDPARGYEALYSVHLVPGPYWVFYGFLHVVGAVLPLRWAAKLFIALTILGQSLGLAALLRQHRAPPLLALAGFTIAWNTNIMWGFVAYCGGVGPLLYGYALLSRYQQASGAARRRLLIANMLLGASFVFMHPLLLLLWAAGVLVYTGWRAIYVGLPSAIVLAGCTLASFAGTATLARGGKIDGVWWPVMVNLKNFLRVQVIGIQPETWRWPILLGLGGVLVAALLLSRRRPEPRDFRPYALVAVIVALYFVLPRHIYQPLTFVGVNLRLEIIIVLVAFVVVAGRALEGWRELVVIVPLVALTLAYHVDLTRRVAAFGARERDFYELVDRAPPGAEIATLIYDADDPALGYRAWRKFAAYVFLERGGYTNALWEESSGIGKAKFPAGFRDGVTPRMPVPEKPEAFDWARHGPTFAYVLTRGDHPRGAASRPELVLVEQRGAWRLWRRR